MSIRLAATCTAAAVLCACAGPSSSSRTGGPASTSAAPVVAAPAPSGPPNAPVSRAGTAQGVPLDAEQRRALDAFVARVPPAMRARLRYALAAGDDGKRHLVVYDGLGLGVEGRHPGRKREYIVFKVLNGAPGEHYDPLQNSLVAPIPPPALRDPAVK